MVPIRDDNPTQTTPYVTYALIVINIAVFIYELSLAGPSLEAFLRDWAVVPRELTASLGGQTIVQGPPELLTLITSQFLHGGFLHVGGNMLYLWIFGNNVEDRMGHVRFTVFYLLCGVLASLAQWYFSQGSNIPSLGASGAIAGVMGAYFLKFPGTKILTLLPLGFLLLPIRIPAIFFLGIWFAQQALYGLASLQAPTNIGMESGGVAYWAHAGGFVFGALLAPLFGMLSKPRDPYSGYR
ncbi:rhomboid family intramembrane serine protease [Microcoleus sp. FACHB-1515]|uniref:rhomboid family intramembrane serine protease n=1 Tax=Cyanophyceae TaxID=3028117 RepID=UPI0016828834|nr:rhomboid family intramembrane serine protease [Microcoleus sp. FACHB-1515]MBD2089301.1 rhomboid family intramembrane serine protease [Microcoleus sp. FACHB-1515]